MSRDGHAWLCGGVFIGLFELWPDVGNGARWYLSAWTIRFGRDTPPYCTVRVKTVATVCCAGVESAPRQNVYASPPCRSSLSP